MIFIAFWDVVGCVRPATWLGGSDPELAQKAAPVVFETQPYVHGSCKPGCTVSVVCISFHDFESFFDA